MLGTEAVKSTVFLGAMVGYKTFPSATVHRGARKTDLPAAISSFGTDTENVSSTTGLPTKELGLEDTNSSAAGLLMKLEILGPAGEKPFWLPAKLPASELEDEGTNSGAVGLPTGEKFLFLPDTSLGVGDASPWLPPWLPASELGDEGTNSGTVGSPTKEVEGLG